eukprot:maker-scaffold82_size396747-snap-gene-2.41 protein:Tk06844 transcript:maker-scaffold82_size396747-snap-gene-2.41-mRNA-1 annotation:"hypothetical protein"
METWRAFRSQDGPGGSRNALGQVLFPSNVATRLTRSEAAGVVSPHLPYAANTLVDNGIAVWNKETLDSDFVEIIRGIDAANAWYRSLGQLPLYLAERVTEYGEVYITTDENLLYSYLFLPNLLGFPHMRMSNDAIYNFYMSLRVPRFSTFTQDMDRLLRMSHEMGLSQKALYDPIPIIALPSTISSSQVINSEVKMSLPMVWAAIFFMIGGAIISTLAFLGEVVVGRCAILVKNASLAKAQSEITQDVCDCQCNNYTFKFDNTLHGNCLQPYKGALWCYVKDFGQSTCIDRLESSRVSGLFWSFQACGTPKYQDCLGVINRDQDRNNPDRSNDGYDYYEEDDLPDISVFTRTNLRDNQKNGGQIIFGDGQVPNEENDSVNFDSQP